MKKITILILTEAILFTCAIAQEPDLMTNPAKTTMEQTHKNGMVNAYNALKRVKEIKEDKGTRITPPLWENANDIIYIPTLIAEGQWGAGEREFGYYHWPTEPANAPRAITVKDDILYVLDSRNARIVKFTTEGTYLGIVELEKIKELKVRGKKWKISKNAAKSEIAPKVYIGGEFDFLEIDNEECMYLYVSAGWGISRVVIYSHKGKFIAELSEEDVGYEIQVFFSDKNGEIYIGQIHTNNQKGNVVMLPSGQRNYFKISSSRKIKKVKMKELPESKSKLLWKEIEKPKVTEFAKLDKITAKLIEVHNKKPWLGRTIKLSSGEIYQIVYDDENVDLGWKIIKWEKQK
ncbi:hypothetical protein KKF70_02970 [bacterium]|nr:hypothetical protein [bacterium]